MGPHTCSRVRGLESEFTEGGVWLFSRELGKKMDKKNPQCGRGNEQLQKLEGNRKLLPIKHYLRVCVLGAEVVGVFRIFLGGRGMVVYQVCNHSVLLQTTVC